MKRPEDMTDAELSAELASYQGQAQPTQTGINMAAMRRPEDMTDAELAQELAGYKSGALNQEKIDISNEAADIPWQDRLIVKNLGGSVEDQVSYLRQRNPYLDIRAHEGDIIAKIPGEKKFKRLDPSWSASPQELVQDITDIGYDVGSGILTGAAGAAGAVPGALAGFGVGGLGTAVAASGAASAGLEGFRQVLGKAAGARKDISGGEIALSGILGGATTGIFGGGASKALIEKAVENPKVLTNQLKKVMEVIPEDMADDAKKAFAKQVIEDSQKGLIAKNFGSKATSLVSGIDVNSIEKANQTAAPELVARFEGILDPSKKYTMMEVSDIAQREGAGEIGAAAVKEFVGASNEYKNSLQGKLRSILQKIDIEEFTVDSNKFREPLEDYIESLVEQMKTEPGGGTKATQELLDEARKAAGLFGVKEGGRHGPRTEEPLNLSAQSFYDLKNSISDRLDFNASQVALDGKPIKSRRVKEILSNINKDMGTELDKLMKRFSGNENIRQDYAKLKNFQRVLGPKFKNEETALKTLGNSKTMSNKVVRKNIEDFSKEISGNKILLDLADLAMVNKTFGDAPLEAVSAGGATSTSKFLRGGTMGVGAGYLAGLSTGIPGAANTGAMIGGGLGALATSPAAIKQLLKLQGAASKAGGSAVKQAKIPELKKYLLDFNEKYAADELKKAQEYLTPQAAAQSAWQMMGGR